MHHHHGHGLHQQERIEKFEARVEENMAANAFARGDIASGIALEADAMRHRQNAAVIDDVRHGYMPGGVAYVAPAVVVPSAYVMPAAPAYGTPVPQPGYSQPPPAAPLPPGWEELREPSGRIYYGNPALKIVQYERPGFPAQPHNPYGGQQQQQQQQYSQQQQYPQQQQYQQQQQYPQQQQYQQQQQYPRPNVVPSGYPPIPQAIGQTVYGQTAVVYNPTVVVPGPVPVNAGYPPIPVAVAVVGGGYGAKGMERREEATAAIENQMAMNALARGDVNSFVALESDAMRHQANANALHQMHHHHHHHHGHHHGGF
jgi:hypothetical protein